MSRTIWDGDRVLYEIRAPESQMENDAATGALWGSVAYTHGPDIDRPLDVIRSGFELIDSPTDEYGFEAWGGPYPIMPHLNWRWVPDGAATPNGKRLPCLVPGDPCPIVQFPGSLYHRLYGSVSDYERNVWFGSLIEEKADDSGLRYMRNRYFNPETGQFTQEDPIGLAGGLNVYGYANGDPTSYIDPYGLRPQDIIIHGSAEYRKRVLNALVYAAQRSETFRTAYNALASSKQVTIHIGANFLPGSGATHSFKRGFGSEGRIRLELVDDDEELGFLGAHELFHAAGAFSQKVPEANVPSPCGNDHDPSVAHACVNPREQQTRDEVAEWKRRASAGGQ